MFRPFHVVTIIAILAAGVAHSSAQPSSEASRSRSAFEEAKQLHELVEKLYGEGKFLEAITPAERVLALREEMLGPMHADVASSLDELAVLYREQGAYSQAEPVFARALNISEKALGPMHPHVAITLNGLAVLYREQGAYGKAEPLLLRSHDIREKALGPMHPAVALSLSNLAALYQDQGAYAKAELLSVRALAIAEAALGPNHRDLAIALNNLAFLYDVQGAYAKAEPLYVRALAIAEKVLGPGHPDVAIDLNNLAVLYKVQGAYAKAKPLYVRALDITEKALGPSHPSVAIKLNNLATLYRDQGAYARAEPLYVRALAIRETALGPSHPLVATSLNNLASLYRAQGAYAKAELLVARAADIQEQQLRTELIRLSESRKRALMTLLGDETESVVSLHADAMPSSGSALELALTTVLRRKARILDSIVDGDTRIRSHLTTPLRGQLDQLARARSELVAQLYTRSGSPDRASITATRTRIDELEAKLSAASAEFRTEAAPITLAKIQASLPARTALVELVHYRRDDPRQPEERRWKEERYVAYIATSGGAPQWVALGEAAPIDAQIDTVLAAVQSKATDETTRAELHHLDSLVLAPIRARLSGVSHLIVAPDGKLNLVPFEALVDAQGRYALENYLVSYVTTGRDLLRLAVPHSSRSPAVVMADPDYGPAGMASFTPLPEARAEAMDLQGYFPGAPVTGGKATKSALAALIGPATLHVATHGFYARHLGPRTSAVTAPLAARGMFIESTVLRSRAEDPTDALDRAGLAMAGANRGAGGIVTARELAGFDWSGTQLVVLSACETAVGEVLSGDGVYGMRRALVLAGSASQVVSLWSVSDASTRLLMRDYYRELASGTGRAEALRRAKLGLLREPRYAHPYYWAAFIPAGDWQPLDKNALRLSSHRGDPDRNHAKR